MNEQEQNKQRLMDALHEKIRIKAERKVKYPIKVTPKPKHNPATCEIALWGRCLSCEQREVK